MSFNGEGGPPVSPVPEPSNSDLTVGETLKEPPRYAKAIMAAALAGTGTAAVAAQDGFSAPEVWGIVAVAVAAFVGVFGVKNRGE